MIFYKIILKFDHWFHKNIFLKSLLLRTMLHASETWPLTKTNVQYLQSNDRAMIRQICSIKPGDVAMERSSKLLAKLEDLNLILRERLRRLSLPHHLDGEERADCFA